MAGFRSLLAPWVGGAGIPASGGVQAGLRSFWWAGGAGVPSATETPTGGYRSPLATWVGGAGVPSAAAASSRGYRSLLAPWVGGAGAPVASGTSQPGMRPFGWWTGGAGIPPTVDVVPGFRSMLALWVGGAGAPPFVEPPIPPDPTPTPGGGAMFAVPPDIREAMRLRLIDEDDVLLLLLASQFAKRLQ